MVADDDLFVANNNHALMDEDESATGLENAISILKTVDAQAPESKNMKAPNAPRPLRTQTFFEVSFLFFLPSSKVSRQVLYAAFQDKTMPALREENPGLKLSQYKDRCFALWQKHPDNPNNRAGAAVAKPEATTAP